jgi:Ras-related protein Rab-7A
MPYVETSAKEDINVEPAFVSVARSALAHEKQEDLCVGWARVRVQERKG